MTTSQQPAPLSTDEIACLRTCANNAHAVAPHVRETLAAKGMLQREAGHYLLTPAGRHALDVGEPGTVPGLDN